jgi:hypothetical protein
MEILKPKMKMPIQFQHLQGNFKQAGAAPAISVLIPKPKPIEARSKGK